MPAAEIRSALDAQFTPDGLRAEAEYARLSGTGLRHYGWGWALSLAHELASWAGDADARRWAAAMEPLAEALTANFLRWLPKATYPIRVGVHPTARSRCPGPCRTRGCWSAAGAASWPGPSRTPPAAGTPPTPATRAAGSPPGTTSCRPR